MINEDARYSSRDVYPQRMTRPCRSWKGTVILRYSGENSGSSLKVRDDYSQKEKGLLEDLRNSQVQTLSICLGYDADAGCQDPQHQNDDNQQK